MGQTLSKAELKKLIVSASNPQDHERIVPKHFDTKAASWKRDGKDHEELAADYNNSSLHHNL